MTDWRRDKRAAFRFLRTSTRCQALIMHLSLDWMVAKINLEERRHNSLFRDAACAHAEKGARKGGRRNSRSVSPVITLNMLIEVLSRMRFARPLITLCVGPLLKPRNKCAKLSRIVLPLAARRAQRAKMRTSRNRKKLTSKWAAMRSRRRSSFVPSMSSRLSLEAICECNSATSAERLSRSALLL